jgi:hypothetical protein
LEKKIMDGGLLESESATATPAMETQPDLLALVVDRAAYFQAYSSLQALSVLATEVVSADRQDVIRAVCLHHDWRQEHFLIQVIREAGRVGKFGVVRCALNSSSTAGTRSLLWSTIGESARSGDLALLQFLDAWNPDVMNVWNTMIRALEAGHVHIGEWLLPRFIGANHNIWRGICFYVGMPMHTHLGASRSTDERMWALVRPFIDDAEGVDVRDVFKKACRNNHMCFAELLFGSDKVVLSDKLFTPTDLRVCVKFAPEVAKWLVSILPRGSWPNKLLQSLHLSPARTTWMHAVVAAGMKHGKG